MLTARSNNYRQYRGDQLVTAPVNDPVTVTDVEGQLKIGDSGEDTQIQLYIDASVQFVENLLNIALITQTWKMVLDHWPNQREPWWNGVREAHANILNSPARSRSSNILLSRYPLQSIDSMTVDSASITVGDYFIVDTVQKKGRLVLKYGETLPVLTDESANGIEITYTVGYGANATDVPADIRLAITMMAAHLYEHRGDGCSTESAYVASGAKSMVEKYKVVDL